MIAKHTPILESCDGVLYARSSPTMTPPRRIAENSAATKYRRDELENSAIPTVGEHATMLPTHGFEVTATVMDWIVAVAGPAAADGDHVQVRSADEDLGIARPTVVLGLRRDGVIAHRDQGAVQDP